MDLFACDIMTSPVISVREETTVRDLISLLQEKQISGVPVIDAEDRLVGVISITDLLALSADTDEATELEESDFHTSPAMDGLSRAQGLLEPEEALLGHPIQGLMSRNVITATEQTHIGELADMMISHRIHRLIIVREENIEGIVSVRDILRTLRDRYRSSLEQG